MASWTTPKIDRTSTDIAYNYDDLSRVEENTQYLADELDGMGYNNSIVTKYPWTRTGYSGDIFNEDDDTRYLGNVKQLADFMAVSVPVLPDNMNDLTRLIANNIEKTLQTVKDRFETIEQNLLYCVIECGADRTRQFVQRGS